MGSSFSALLPPADPSISPVPDPLPMPPPRPRPPSPRPRAPVLFNHLLARAEACPTPSPLPDPAPHHLLPRTPADSHLQAAFEHALVYDGLSVTAAFSIPVRPPPRPKRCRGKHSRPRARQPPLQRSLRSDPDLPPVRVPREPDRNARILAEDAIQIDRKTTPATAPPIPPPPIPVSEESSGEEYVQSDDEPAAKDSDVEHVKPTRASPRLKDDQPTPTTPLRSGKMQRLRRGAASVCASPARNEPPASVPPPKPEPAPAPPPEKERSPKATRVSKTVSSPVKRLSDKRPAGGKPDQRADKDNDEIMEVDIVPVRVKHAGTSKQSPAVAQNAAPAVCAAKPLANKRKEPEHPDSEASWLSDAPLGTGVMPKAAVVDDNVSPVLQDTRSPRTAKRSSRSTNAEKKAEMSNKRKTDTTTAKEAVPVTSPTLAAKPKQRIPSPQTPRKRNFDAAANRELVPVNTPRRKAARIAERTSAKSGSMDIGEPASPALSKRKSTRIAGDLSPKKEVSDSKASDSPSLKKPHKSDHAFVKLRSLRGSFSSPAKKSEPKSEVSKVSPKTSIPRPSERANAGRAKTSQGNGARIAGSNSGTSISPLREKLAVNTRLLPKAKRTLFSRTSDSHLFRKDRRIFSPLAKNARQRKEGKSDAADYTPSSSPAVKTTSPIRRASEPNNSARREEENPAKSQKDKKNISGKTPPPNSNHRRESPRWGNVMVGKQRRSSPTTKKGLRADEGLKSYLASPVRAAGVKRPHSDITSPGPRATPARKIPKRGRTGLARESEPKPDVHKAKPESNRSLKTAEKTEERPVSSPHPRAEQKKKEMKSLPGRRLSDVATALTLKGQSHEKVPEMDNRSSSLIRLRLRRPAASDGPTNGPGAVASPSCGKFPKSQPSTVSYLAEMRSSEEILKESSPTKLEKMKRRESSSSGKCAASPLHLKQDRIERGPVVGVQKKDDSAAMEKYVCLSEDDFLNIPVKPKVIDCDDTFEEIQPPRVETEKAKGRRSPAKRAWASPKSKSATQMSTTRNATEAAAHSDEVIQVEVRVFKPKPVHKEAEGRLQPVNVTHPKRELLKSKHRKPADKRICQVSDEDEEIPSASTEDISSDVTRSRRGHSPLLNSLERTEGSHGGQNINRVQSASIEECVSIRGLTSSRVNSHSFMRASQEMIKSTFERKEASGNVHTATCMDHGDQSQDDDDVEFTFEAPNGGNLTANHTTDLFSSIAAENAGKQSTASEGSRNPEEPKGSKEEEGVKEDEVIDLCVEEPDEAADVTLSPYPDVVYLSDDNDGCRIVEVTRKECTTVTPIGSTGNGKASIPR